MFLICLALGTVEGADIMYAMALGAIGGAIFILPFSVYHFIMYSRLKSRINDVAPTEMRVSNWRLSFLFRSSAAVTVELDGCEYWSAAYFSRDEAMRLVGKSISAAVIDGKLFVYDIGD